VYYQVYPQGGELGRWKLGHGDFLGQKKKPKKEEGREQKGKGFPIGHAKKGEPWVRKKKERRKKRGRQTLHIGLDHKKGGEEKSEGGRVRSLHKGSGRSRIGG